MTIADLTMMGKETSQKWWWIDSNVASPRSPWLQYSLGELERKTKAMLKVIEEDADSFAQRAEMYYKKRPELINMVEDFYRAHRSLVEQYDQLKSETGGSRRRLLSLTSSLSVDFERGRRSRMSVMMDDQTCDCKSTASGRMGDDDHQAYDCKSTLSGGMDDDDHQHHQAYDCKSTMSGGMDDDDDHQTPYHCKSTLSRGMEDDDDHQASYDCKSTTSHSDVYDLEDSAAESEVDDPDEEILGHDDSLVVMDEIEEVGPERFGKSAAAALDEMTREWETRFASQNEEMKHLKEEMERVKEENRIQKEELKQKDEEKREVIRQLSLGMEMLRSENSELRKQQQQVPKEKRSSPFEFGKLKDSLFTKLFQGSPPISKASSRVAGFVDLTSD